MYILVSLEANYFEEILNETIVSQFGLYQVIKKSMHLNENSS